LGNGVERGKRGAAMMAKEKRKEKENNQRNSCTPMTQRIFDSLFLFGLFFS